MISKLEKFLFLLTIFFISSQFGFHFWPKFSYINGIRIDYLSPTLYLSDFLILLLAFLFFLKKPRNKIPIKSPLNILLFLFTLGLLWNFFISKTPQAHFFGIIKLFEFSFLAFYISVSFKKKDIPAFVNTVLFSALLSSFLAIWQFLKQSSIGGIWYFLGERSFNTSTIGISTVNLNQEILRPYAAFPHPNVLAFFLFMAIVFSVHRIGKKKNFSRIFLISSIIILLIALLLTFSRILIFAVICFLFFEIYTKRKSNVIRSILIIVAVIAIGYLITAFPYKNFLIRGIDFRIELLSESLSIFSNNLLFGTGLNNFFINQAPLIKTISPIIFQPPHNIFVLWLLETGIVGFLIFPYLLFLAFHSLVQKLQTTNSAVRTFYRGILILLIAVIIVGMFDHFFLTLQQGQLMLALILGLSFSKING